MGCMGWQSEHARLAALWVAEPDPRRRRQLRESMIGLRCQHGGSPLEVELPAYHYARHRLDPHADAKLCHRCNETYPLETGFGKQTASRDGRDSLCRECRRKSNEMAKRKYREKLRRSATRPSDRSPGTREVVAA